MKMAARALLPLLVVVSFAMVAAPMYFLGPTRAQTAEDIERGYRATLAGPSVTLAALVLGLVLTAILWRGGAGWMGKALTIAACGALGLATHLARGSFTERIFTPLPEVVRIAATETTHVDTNDLVLGVRHAGEAAAYPVPIIAYHHIVNDRLADEPFVVTY